MPPPCRSERTTPRQVSPAGVTDADGSDPGSQSGRYLTTAPGRGLPDTDHSREVGAHRFSTGDRIDRIGVVVPVNNEEQEIRHCLDALGVAAFQVTVPVTVIVVLDACTDGSAAIVNGLPVQAIAVDAHNVGVTRAAGMAELLERHGEAGTWLATTDGDSVVPRNWFTAQMRHADGGARVVAGTVSVQDWEDRSGAVRSRARRDYRAVPHRHVHGANLSFAATAYRAAGGFRPLASHEDVQLVDAFRANAEPIAWAMDLPVVTSARRNARAPRGFASYLTSLENSLQSGQGS